MSSRKAFAGCPTLITHWDPDMYPNEPLPLVPELVVYLLAHGQVWLKEVDLFLNPKIASYLSDPTGFQQFSSLVATKRIKVLIPDQSRNLDDPINHPILSTAMEIVRSKRPLKSRPWTMTEKDKQLCEALDTMLVATGPEAKWRSASQDRTAKQREHVRGQAYRRSRRPRYTLAATRRVQGYRSSDRTAVCQARAKPRISYRPFTKERHCPQRNERFLPLIALPCADHLLPSHHRSRRSMKNLGQSVYAHCELDREKAVGTYYGSRVAEPLPPTGKGSGTR